MVLKDFILNSIEHYDNQHLKYKKIILSKSYTIDNENNITFINKHKELYKFDYEILGYFDIINKIWIWSWVFPGYTTDKTNISRQLLNYGLSIEPPWTTVEQSILISIFVNSRLKFHEFIELELMLALCCYIMKNNIKFIYSVTKYKTETAVGILYYIIK